MSNVVVRLTPHFCMFPEETTLRFPSWQSAIFYEVKIWKIYFIRYFLDWHSTHVFTRFNRESNRHSCYFYNALLKDEVKLLIIIITKTKEEMVLCCIDTDCEI